MDSIPLPPNKQTIRLDAKTKLSILWHTGNSSQQQRQALLHSEKLGKIFQASGPKKQAEVAILLLNKTKFQQKVIKKVKEGHFYSSKENLLR